MDSLLEELHCLLDQLVDQVLAKAGLNAPPVDAEKLARQKVWLSFGLEAPRQYRKPPPASFDQLEPDAPVIRRQWQAAQYLGSIFQTEAKRLWQDSQGDDAIAGISWINLLAQRFLVPSAWFQSACAELDYNLLELKSRFKTAPYEILALRMLDLPRVCVVTIVDNGHPGKRKSNGFKAGRGMHPAEEEALRYAQEYSRYREVSRGGWQVRCWPVHGLDWKREVILSWPPEELDAELE